MKGSDIKNLVIVKLEEKSAFLPNDGASGPVLSGGDILNELKPIYSYIDEQLSIAANEVLKIAPLSMIYPAFDDEDMLLLDGNELKVPDDFLRLYSIKASDWSRPVHTAITKEHPLYIQQHNPYTCGSKTKPVVVYDGEVDGVNKTLKLYSTEVEDADSIDFTYVRKFGDKESYSDSIAEAIALNCAKKVYEIYGNTEMATTMQSELTAVLNNMQV